MTPHRILSLALGAAALTACIPQATPPAAGTGSVTPATLAGTSWRFVTIDGQPPVAPEAKLVFTADHISANTGCNGVGGNWTLRDGRIAGGPYMATQMYCEGRMEQERAVAGLLEEQPSVSVAGDRLVLRSATHSAELQRAVATR
jgi:heat shock protein HslJ